MKKLILLMSLLPAIALANPYMHEHADGVSHERHCMIGKKHMRLPPYLHHLDLTKQQQQQIRDLMKSHFNKAKSERKQEFALREQIHQLSFSANYDTGKLSDLTSQLAQIKQQNILQRAQLNHEIYAELTEAQQQKLQKRMKAMQVLRSDS